MTTATKATGTATPHFSTFSHVSVGCFSEGERVVFVRGAIITGTASQSHHPAPVSEGAHRLHGQAGFGICSNRTATGLKGGVL